MARVGPVDDPDRYELAELRSRGGEGELWRASILVDGQQLPVAIKIIHPANADANLDEWIERWGIQAELLRSLDHPGVVKVREVFQGPLPHEAADPAPVGASLYLVMNWVDGQALPTWVAQNEERDVLASTRVVSRLAAAVEYLHSGEATGGSPVLHRDIKPANVIVHGADVRLVDFGFARLAGDQLSIVGTPTYLAPEVVAGASPSESSDRYGLGATAYFALTGSDPTPNDESATRSRLNAVAGIEDREAFADHVLSMMSRDPSRRPGNVVEWAQALAVGAVSQTFPTMAGGASETVVSGRRGAATELSPAPPTPTPAKTKRSRRGWVIGIAAAVVVLGAAGGAFAVMSADSSSSSSKAPSSGGSQTLNTTEAAARLPDVTGLDVVTAKAKLRKAGVRQITVDYQESAETPGTVLSQLPASGSVPKAVTLTVAKQAEVVPNVIGQMLPAAKIKLEALGATVNTTEQLDDAKPDGTVLAQDPVAGSALSQQVTLRVARQPVVTFLADLKTVGYGSINTGTANVNGAPYTRSVWECTYSGNDPSVASYNLGRPKTSAFVASLGLRDDSTGTSGKFEVFGDDRQLYSQTASLGQMLPLNIDVSGILRLKISYTALGTSPGTSCGVFGAARILSSPTSPFTTSTTVG